MVINYYFIVDIAEISKVFLEQDKKARRGVEV
jgi:hypothetical protein